MTCKNINPEISGDTSSLTDQIGTLPEIPDTGDRSYNSGLANHRDVSRRRQRSGFGPFGSSISIWGLSVLVSYFIWYV